MAIKYEATSDVVKVWFGETEEPNLLQPHYPNGDAWGSKENADVWAKAYVDAIENPESEFVPGDSAAEPIKPRPVSEIVEPVVEETPVDESTPPITEE